MNDRIVIDSQDVKSKIEGKMLQFFLEKADISPSVVDSELVAIGGWKLNAVSLIHSQASPEMVVRGWKSLEQLVPMDRLLVPFLYASAFDYIRFNICGIEPSWTKLLRLCYWYERCLGLKDKNFHFKQTEIRRAILRPLRNAEKTLDNKGRDFIPTMEQLGRVISSYTSELVLPTLLADCGGIVSFGKEHDFFLNTAPCEVKSLYSRKTIERKQNGSPKLTIHGQTLGKKINPYDELFKFITSKKALSAMINAFSQGGELIFLDITHTFANLLLHLFSLEKGVNLTFSKALSNCFKITKTEKKKIPVVVISSISTYEHQFSAFVIPMPVQIFQSI